MKSESLSKYTVFKLKFPVIGSNFKRNNNIMSLFFKLFRNKLSESFNSFILIDEI